MIPEMRCFFSFTDSLLFYAEYWTQGLLLLGFVTFTCTQMVASSVLDRRTEARAFSFSGISGRALYGVLGSQGR